MSGKIIVIDGGANIGKATQADMLVNRLTKEGVAVEKMDFPRYHQNTMGRLISECMRGERDDIATLDPRIVATLFAADRFESKPEFERWLAEGKTVIFDRYVTSNMLHQGARILDVDARGEFFKWVEYVEHGIFKVPRPDMTVYLDVPPDDSLKLLEYVEEIGGEVVAPDEKKKLHQLKVAESARYVAAIYQPWVSVTCVTEAGELRPREEIHEEVYDKIRDIL